MSNKVLVVDDDPAARKILALLLQSTCEIIEAAAGEEALRIIEAERPRLMLLDMVMPGMSGLEVLEVAKRSGMTMTILVLTGQKDIELAKRALELGAVEYITKPLDLAYLKDRVIRCLKAIEAEGKRDSGVPWRTDPADPAKPVVPKPETRK